MRDTRFNLLASTLLVLLLLNCTSLDASGGMQSAGKDNKAGAAGNAAASYFPNTVLVTQDNEDVQFFDDLLKGKTVVINFMFTTCTSICPPMTANLANVQAILGDRVGKDINMISLTVDAATDTPAVLKAYATKFRVRPGWRFVTGKKTDMDLVLRKVGGYVTDKNDHTSLLIIGNVGTGDWVKTYALGKPSEIAATILKVADAKKE
jgi:cytochrome oxidase Cu insertion factor (SCO1/SenC/PrrC family)